MPIAMNLGPHDDWERMVPEAVRRQFPDLIETLDFLVANPNSREAVLSLFWKIYGIPKAKPPPRQAILEKVDSLERKLNRDLHMDLKVGVKDTGRFFVYLHVAGCLMTVLEKTETYRSERFIETLQEIDSFWNLSYRSKCEQLGEDDPFVQSLYTLVAIVGTKLFGLDDSQGKWEHAFFHLTSTMAFPEAWFDVDSLDPQAPVDTFEKLWDNPSKVTSWQTLALYCDVLAWNDMLYNAGYWEAGVHWKGEELDFHTFWVYAEGLCKSRLSPTEYNEQRECDKQQESERRLRNYFFYDCWDSIPSEDQGDLIAIDKLWFSQEWKINLGAIVSNLKIVTEHFMRRLLWGPFIQWRETGHARTDIKELKKETRFAKRLQDLYDRNHDPALPDFLAMLRLATFRIFINQTFSPDECAFVLNKLEAPIVRLNPERARREHKVAQAWQRKEVFPLLKEVFGIDCIGILPFLARMLKVHGSGIETN